VVGRCLFGRTRGVVRTVDGRGGAQGCQDAAVDSEDLGDLRWVVRLAAACVFSGCVCVSSAELGEVRCVGDGG
jgi:hypothetical protein